MTNQQIVFNESCRLMQAGVIKGTGRKVEIETTDGKVLVIEEPEALYTYRAWKQRGRQVKKGEKAVAQFPIWKQGKARTIKADDGTEEEQAGRMFMKLSSFFKLDQTEPIKA